MDFRAGGAGAAPGWPLQFVRFITLSQLMRRIGN
jgi:hypothetical protein